MRNVGLEEAQARIKIAGRNINNFRYADDTTFMAENEKELKSVLLKVKEESEKVGLKLNTQKTKIKASGPINSVQFSHSVVSNSLQSHESQHAKPPCPAPTQEFTQTHVHPVGDAIHPSHPLSCPSPPPLNPSQHQSFSNESIDVNLSALSIKTF